MPLLDSRRLTGPNLLLDGPGAALEVDLAPFDPGAAEAVAALWREGARRLVEAVGWGGERLAARPHRGGRGLSLALSAPLDALYAATEVAEEAWRMTEAAFGLAEGPDEPGRPLLPLAEIAGRLREAIAAERNPRLLALAAAAAARGVAFLWDAERATVGLGAGSATWPIAGLPSPGDVDWAAVRDVPVAL